MLHCRYASLAEDEDEEEEEEEAGEASEQQGPEYDPGPSLEEVDAAIRVVRVHAKLILMPGSVPPSELRTTST